MGEYSVNFIVIGSVVALAVFTVVILVIYFCFCRKKVVIQHANKVDYDLPPSDYDLSLSFISSMIQQKGCCKFSIENENYDFSHLCDKEQKKIISGIEELVKREKLEILGKNLKRMLSYELANYFVDEDLCKGELFLISIYHYYFIVNQTQSKEVDGIKQIVALMTLCEPSYDMEQQKLASGLWLDEKDYNFFWQCHSFWKNNGFFLLEDIIKNMKCYQVSKKSRIFEASEEGKIFEVSEEGTISKCIDKVNEFTNKYQRDILLTKIIKKYNIACDCLKKVRNAMNDSTFKQYCIANKNGNLKNIVMSAFSLSDQKFLSDQSWMDIQKINDFCFEEDDFKKCISSGRLPITMFVSKINHHSEKRTALFLKKIMLESNRAKHSSGDSDAKDNSKEENDDNVNTFDNCYKIVNKAIDVIEQYIKKNIESFSSYDDKVKEAAEEAEKDIKSSLNDITYNVKAIIMRNKKHLLSDIIYNIINESYFDFKDILPEILLKYNHESTNPTDTESTDTESIDTDCSSGIQKGIDSDVYLDIKKIIDDYKCFDEKDESYGYKFHNQFYKIADSVFNKYQKEHLDPLENNKQHIEDLFKKMKCNFNTNSKYSCNKDSLLSDIVVVNDDPLEKECFYKKIQLIELLFCNIDNIFKESQLKPFSSTEDQNFTIGDAESILLPSGAANKL